MSLNISKGNMYKHITHTWNPLGGECYHGCTYCSTNKLKESPVTGKVIKQKYSGEPKLYPNYLNDKFKDDYFIFVVAQNDLFAENVDTTIISRILEKLNKHKAKYLIQTKNPARLYGWVQNIPSNSIICTTIETNRWYHEIMNQCPKPTERAVYMSKIGLEKHVTIEPIMDFDMSEMISLIRMCNPTHVNIGADSGKNNLPEPPKEKIFELISELEKFTIVKQKKNLKRLIK